MIARVWYEPQADAYVIALADRGPDGYYPLSVGEDGRLEYGEIVPPHAAMPVTLRLRADLYEDLRRALIGEAIDHDDALRDTRQVRDRLLTIVEHNLAPVRP